MANAKAEHARWRPTWVGAVRRCVWLYVVALLAVWLLLRFGGDRWWLATVMLFGPRWVYGLPLLLLVPAAAAPAAPSAAASGGQCNCGWSGPLRDCVSRGVGCSPRAVLPSVCSPAM